MKPFYHCPFLKIRLIPAFVKLITALQGRIPKKQGNALLTQVKMQNPIPHRTIWQNPDNSPTIQVLDQRRLPHEIAIQTLTSVQEVVAAIQAMVVRGAPLIGATAAYGVWFACREAAQQPQPADYLSDCLEQLRQSRPTAVNLFWAIARQQAGMLGLFPEKSS